jgi:hypothetical protein
MAHEFFRHFAKIFDDNTEIFPPDTGRLDVATTSSKMANAVLSSANVHRASVMDPNANTSEQLKFGEPRLVSALSVAESNSNLRDMPDDDSSQDCRRGAAAFKL